MWYIKTIGIRNKPISIFEGRFPRMLLSHMCFKDVGGEVQNLKREDKLIIYCIKNGIGEFPNGGFIGIQEVLSEVYEDHNLFGKPWLYVVDIQPKIYTFRNIISLKYVRSRRWEEKTDRLKKALKVKLQAKGGLLPLYKVDYEEFLFEFNIRTKPYYGNN